MNTRWTGWWFLLLSIATALSAAAAEKARLKVEPISSYANRQTQNGVTIAAVPYARQEEIKPLFGKANLLEFGVLPVLLIVQNDSGKAIKLESMQLYYVTPEQRKVEETPAEDVRFLDAPRRPNFGGSPVPNPLPRRRVAKSKLDVPQIEELAFAARMLPPGDSAHGIVYFQIAHRKGATLYVKGITEAATGTELLYFEVPLD